MGIQTSKLKELATEYLESKAQATYEKNKIEQTIKEAQTACNLAVQELETINSSEMSDDMKEECISFIDSLYPIDYNEETKKYERTTDPSLACKFKAQRIQLNGSTKEMMYANMIVLKYRTHMINVKSISDKSSPANKQIAKKNSTIKTIVQFEKEKCSDSKSATDDNKNISLWNQIGFGIADINTELGQDLQDLWEVPTCIDGWLNNILHGFFVKWGMLTKKDLNIDSMINDIMSYLNKLLGAQDILPDVPGLSDIVNLITLISKIKPDADKSVPEIDVAIPPNVFMSILGIIGNVSVIIGMLPIVLIRLIFDMLKVIVQQLKNLGAPIPYPLDLIPKAIELIPDIINAMLFIAPTLKIIMEQKIKDILAQMTDLKMPSLDLIGTLLKNLKPGKPCPNKSQSKNRYIGMLKERIDLIDEKINDVKKSYQIKKDQEDYTYGEIMNSNPSDETDFPEIDFSSKDDAKVMSDLESLKTKLQTKLKEAENKYNSEELPLNNSIKTLLSEITEIRGKIATAGEEISEEEAQKRFIDTQKKLLNSYRDAIEKMAAKIEIENDEKAKKALQEQKKLMEKQLKAAKLTEYDVMEKEVANGVKQKQSMKKQLEKQLQQLENILKKKRKEVHVKKSCSQKCSKCGRNPKNKFCPM